MEAESDLDCGDINDSFVRANVFFLLGGLPVRVTEL